MVALVAIAVGAWEIMAADRGVSRTELLVGRVPTTVYRGAAAGPVVVIAHGFAGSQQLMRPFATTLARNGYIAVTFDFPGHGRNPDPLAGDITVIDGATRNLVQATQQVMAYARTLRAGPVALLGHSMASDIIVRAAEADAAVAGVVAVSMFSPAVTAAAPRNLLVIVGGWEAGLRAEGLRAIGLAAPGAIEGVTYGDVTRGTGRRLDVSEGVEHVAVLYSPQSMRAATAWLDAVFGVARGEAAYADARGPWIMLLLAGIVVMAWPLSRLLPVVSATPVGAGVAWRRLWPAVVAPMLVTPLVLRVVPTHFLPVVVADYLAVHFLLYGVITAGFVAWLGAWPREVAWGRVLLAALAMLAWVLGVLGFVLDTTAVSFAPVGARLGIVGAMAVGTGSFFMAAEWLGRGARGAYLAVKAAFVVSLAIAVALDFERLLFLAIIVPIVVLFFAVYGAFSSWAYRRTGHPFVGAMASALAFAWALGVTFPLLAG